MAACDHKTHHVPFHLRSNTHKTHLYLISILSRQELLKQKKTLLFRTFHVKSQRFLAFSSSTGNRQLAPNVPNDIHT